MECRLTSIESSVDSYHYQAAVFDVYPISIIQLKPVFSVERLIVTNQSVNPNSISQIPTRAGNPSILGPSIVIQSAISKKALFYGKIYKL